LGGVDGELPPVLVVLSHVGGREALNHEYIETIIKYKTPQRRGFVKGANVFALCLGWGPLRGQNERPGGKQDAMANEANEKRTKGNEGGETGVGGRSKTSIRNGRHRGDEEKWITRGGPWRKESGEKKKGKGGRVKTPMEHPLHRHGLLTRKI